MKMPEYSELYWVGPKARKLADFSLIFLSLPLCAKPRPCDTDPSHTLPRSDSKTLFRTCSWYTHSQLSSRPRWSTWDTCDNWDYALSPPPSCLSGRRPHASLPGIWDNVQWSICCICHFLMISRSTPCSPSAGTLQHPCCFAKIGIVSSYQCDLLFPHPAVCRRACFYWAPPYSPTAGIWLCWNWPPAIGYNWSSTQRRNDVRSQQFSVIILSINRRRGSDGPRHYFTLSSIYNSINKVVLLLTQWEIYKMGSIDHTLLSVDVLVENSLDVAAGEVALHFVEKRILAASFSGVEVFFKFELFAGLGKRLEEGNTVNQINDRH